MAHPRHLQTNVRVSYAAGRWAQLRNFPLWIYRHGGSQEPRPHHLALDQVVVPREHPFWLTHYPPNGWGCSCYVTGARSAEAARRRGGDPDKALPDGWNTIDPKTAAPVGIDRGWDYAPGASVSDTIALGAEKIRSLPPQIGGALGGAMDALIDKYWPMWLSDAELRARREITLVGAIEPALIEALRRRGRAPASAEILIKPGVVAGPKADRHKRHGDALSDQDWLGLPGLLRAPDAVLLDKQTGAVIFVRRNQVGGTQITISVDYRFRKSRETRLGNVVVSAYRPTLETLKNRIKAGMLEVVFGRLG